MSVASVGDVVEFIDGLFQGGDEPLVVRRLLGLQLGAGQPVLDQRLDRLALEVAQLDPGVLANVNLGGFPVVLAGLGG